MSDREDVIVSDGKTSIETFEFSNRGYDSLKHYPKCKDWPVVYLINNDKELYIGETGAMLYRFKQHLHNYERRELTDINVLFNDQFNKSAILDIEQILIRMCSADNKFHLQNENAGQSSTHDYYQRGMYQTKIEDIWKSLKQKGLVNNDYQSLINNDVFKYSPYTSLTEEQNDACSLAIDDIVRTLYEKRKGSFVINGCAGTGKTIVAISLIYKLVNAGKIRFDSSDVDYGSFEEYKEFFTLQKYIQVNRPLKVGFVVPMTSLRKTLKHVFSVTDGLSPGMVIGPSDVHDNEYDVLVVDESHRLSTRKNISYMGAFDNKCREMGLVPEQSSQLDWILRGSKYQVFFYDRNQTVKGSDISDAEFRSKVGDCGSYRLETQMRCKGGVKYIDYLSSIFNCTQNVKLELDNYDFKIFDDVNNMVEAIKLRDREIGLCRNLAGYSWKWISKGMTYDEAIKNGLEDIVIDGHSYVWNMSNSEWIISDNAVNEIGCIHTSQGYDLNYAGIIFGREIDYDESKGDIVINPELFFDTNVKKGIDQNTLKKYIINSYKVMMERGIKGCYVYVCNERLKKYLSGFFS